MAAIQAARTRGVAATLSGMGIPAGDTPSRDGAALRVEDGAIGSAGFNSNGATIDRDTIGTRGAGMVAIRLTARPDTCRAASPPRLNGSRRHGSPERHRPNSGRR